MSDLEWTFSERPYSEESGIIICISKLLNLFYLLLKHGSKHRGKHGAPHGNREAKTKLKGGTEKDKSAETKFENLKLLRFEFYRAACFNNARHKLSICAASGAALKSRINKNSF